MARHDGHRISWLMTEDAAEEQTEHHVFITPGWLEVDSIQVRSSLARALKVEGVASNYWECDQLARDARIAWGHDGETKVTVAAIVAPLP